MKLLIQGRELFSKHGIKKVTVDDLVKAVNISKGSYYAFYNSKEELFMVIVLEETKKLVSAIENDFIDFPKKEIVKKIMLYSVEQYIHNPIFLQINKELTVYLSRKLSSEFWGTYFGQVSLGITAIMEKYNITSNYPVGTITKILNLIYSICYIELARWLEQHNEYRMLGASRAITIKGPWNEDDRPNISPRF